jgi:predicted Zn-dependent protease
MKNIVIFLLTWLLIFNVQNTVSGIEDKLPPSQSYNLPLSLQNWHSDNQDNYFQQIKAHQVGYLIWSSFPVKVYLENSPKDLSPSALSKFQEWQKAVYLAIERWNPYLPMTVVDLEQEADILIYDRQPELKAELDPATGLYKLPRVKAATTSVKLYWSDQKQLKHRMTIEVNPRQTFDYLVSNITHELGHALGIWGHSDNLNDVMYYAHTKSIPSLSLRDINTLKKIYQQPTRLGNYRTSKKE